MDLIDFSEKVQLLRKKRQLSQEELGEMLDVSRQSVSKWESGLAMPEIDKLLLLSEIFEVSTDFLLKPGEPLIETPASAKPAPEDIASYQKIPGIKRGEQLSFLLRLGVIGMIFVAVALYEAIFRTLLLWPKELDRYNEKVMFALVILLSVFVVFTAYVKIRSLSLKEFVSLSIYKTREGKIGLLLAVVLAVIMIIQSTLVMMHGTGGFVYSGLAFTMSLAALASAGLHIFALIKTSGSASIKSEV